MPACLSSHPIVLPLPTLLRPAPARSGTCHRCHWPVGTILAYPVTPHTGRSSMAWGCGLGWGGHGAERSTSPCTTTHHEPQWPRPACLPDGDGYCCIIAAPMPLMMPLSPCPLTHNMTLPVPTRCPSLLTSRSSIGHTHTYAAVHDMISSRIPRLPTSLIRYSSSWPVSRSCCRLKTHSFPPP